MGWPIVRRGPGGNALHVETEFDHAFGGEIPIRIVCSACGVHLAPPRRWWSRTQTG